MAEQKTGADITPNDQENNRTIGTGKDNGGKFGIRWILFTMVLTKHQCKRDKNSRI